MAEPPHNNRPINGHPALPHLVRTLASLPVPPEDSSADGEEEEEPLEPDLVGPVPTRRIAREWGLVLQSMGIGFVMQVHHEGWVLRVAPHLRERALDAIEAYEQENADWPPPRRADKPRHEPSAVIPMAFAALAAFLALTTGPVSSGSVWFEVGRADAKLLLSEPWRMVTALTLHADGKHVLGNLISGGIFGAALSRRIGAGAALLAMVGAGLAGNAANAIYHLAEGHRSIGASTAVFGAVGMLSTVQMLLDRDRPRSRKRRLVELLGPLIGGLALLGALGASPHSDLWAHGFGFAAGALLGVPAGLIERRRRQQPASSWAQLALGAGGLAVVLGSWQVAMIR